MDNRLTFVPLCAEDPASCAAFGRLMRLYAKELDEHQKRATPEPLIEKWTGSIIQALRGDRGRHLELCCDGEALIGFFYGKIDRPGHKGYIKAGYGYIMVFFVVSEQRRKGYGTEMYARLETLLRQDGAARLYLTADPVTGKPFWESLGFTGTGEKSPENKQEIYEKAIPIL